MLKFIKQNRRSFFYGLSISIGLVFLQDLAATGTTTIFVLAVIVVWGILLLEIFANFYFAQALLRQFDLPQVRKLHGGSALIFHAVLPSLIYFSLVGFTFVNNRTNLAWVFFLLSLVIFSMLFINIRAYYEDKYRLESETHLVYDLAKLVIYFCLTNLIANLAMRFNFSFLLIVLLNFVVASALLLLVFLNHRFTSRYMLVISLFAGLALGYLSAGLAAFLVPVPLVTAFYSTLVFYMLNAIIYHELERTITWQTIAEYSLVALICLLIIILLL